MGYNSRILALILAGIIALLTSGFLYLSDGATVKHLIIVAGMSFASAFIFSYLIFEFLIFREVNEMRNMLNKIKRNERIIVRENTHKGSNPIRNLNQEIYDLAYGKQLEIEELKEAEEYRREFLANVSHELKTPIFSAQGFIQTLLDGAMQDEEVQNKFLKKSAKSLDRLSVLVQDLLTISQLESGSITMQKEFFDISRMVDDIFEQLEGKAAKKNCTLIRLPEESKLIETYGDAQRIGQVITNLVENGIKYGNDEGKVRLILEELENVVQVTIADDGPGIDPEKLPRIFERFFRVDKHRSRESGGTGLGLSIVKHIIDSHDAEIKVESEVGEGTIFTFILPHASDVKFSETEMNT